MIRGVGLLRMVGLFWRRFDFGFTIMSACGCCGFFFGLVVGFPSGFEDKPVFFSFFGVVVVVVVRFASALLGSAL